MESTLRKQKMSNSAIGSELAETSGAQVYSSIWRSLARITLHGKVAGQKQYILVKVTQCTKTGTGVQRSCTRCSEMISQNLKYLALAEGSLFTVGLESGTILRVCRQHWSTVEVPWMLGTANLQMELVIGKRLDSTVNFWATHKSSVYHSPKQLRIMFKWKHTEAVNRHWNSVWDSEI